MRVHPDKRPEGEREAARREFDALRKACEELLDAETRRALDERLRAAVVRRAASEARDGKRRRAMEDLEARERRAEMGVGVAEERAARARLRDELERLRRAREPGGGGTGGERASERVDEAVEAIPEHLYRAIKVVWRRDGDADEDSYTAKGLRETYERFGTVEDVVMREGKKKKGSALVVFASLDACARAAVAACGRASNPLISTRAAVPPARTSGGEEQSARTTTAETTAKAKPAQAHAANIDFESAVLERLKRAQERARLVAEAEKRDQ